MVFGLVYGCLTGLNGLKWMFFWRRGPFYTSALRAKRVPLLDRRAGSPTAPQRVGQVQKIEELK